jgi:hypothetical protein
MGRSDILMYPLHPEKDFGIILEFKKCEDEKDLNQMAEKDYAAELQSSGAQKIMIIGIAFCGKTVEIALKHH